jgi:branched-chain amino acid transport system ATP-binding protein
VTPLAVEGVSAFYGAVQALHRVSLRVEPGEIVALIGANGAGKSTLMGAICGDPAPREGRVRLFGRDVTGWPTHRIMREGVAIAPEGRRIFPRLTVEENLALGGFHRDAAGLARSREAVLALFPRLGERLGQRGGLLSGGEQQMLAIGRALMSAPRLLLLDEPSLGLAPLVTRQIMAALAALNAEGLAILLVEQNAFQALRLAHRGIVLANGRVTLEGPARELLAREDVRRAYLEGAPAA